MSAPVGGDVVPTRGQDCEGSPEVVPAEMRQNVLH